MIHKKRNDPHIIHTQTFDTEFCNDDSLVPPSEKKLIETSYHIDPTRAYPVFNGCVLLRCEYFVKTVAITQGLHFNAENKTRIYIGPVKHDDQILEESDANVQISDEVQ